MSRKPESRSKGCPYCGQPTEPEHTPFCSRGCKDRDLLKWLGGGYRIAGPPADPEAIGGLDSEEGQG